jgi:hypothetical protein
MKKIYRMRGWIFSGLIIVSCIAIAYIYYNNKFVHDSDISFKEVQQEHLPFDSDIENINLSVQLIDINRDTLRLEDALMDSCSKYLFFRYSSFNCNSCISETCMILHEYKDKFERVKIVLLPYYESVRDFIIQSNRLLRNHFPIYMIRNNSIGLSVDRANVPYLCYVDGSKSARHILVVDSSHPDIIENYLKFIKEHYDK